MIQVLSTYRSSPQCTSQLCDTHEPQLQGSIVRWQSSSRERGDGSHHWLLISYHMWQSLWLLVAVDILQNMTELVVIIDSCRLRLYSEIAAQSAPILLLDVVCFSIGFGISSSNCKVFPGFHLNPSPLSCPPKFTVTLTASAKPIAG